MAKRIKLPTAANTLKTKQQLGARPPNRKAEKLTLPRTQDTRFSGRLKPGWLNNP